MKECKFDLKTFLEKADFFQNVDKYELLKGSQIKDLQAVIQNIQEKFTASIDNKINGYSQAHSYVEANWWGKNVIVPFNTLL